MAKSNFNPNDLSTWDWWITGILSVVIVGAVVFLADKFLVSDVTKKVEKKNSEIVKLEKTYRNNQKIIALLPHIRKEVSELKLARDEAKKYLPTKVSMPSLIENVYLAARDNEIIFTHFSQKPYINRTYYTIVPISLSATVGYQSMSTFIQQVTTLKRIMNVHSVTFSLRGRLSSEQSANTPLAMTAELRTYIFKDK